MDFKSVDFIQDHLYHRHYIFFLSFVDLWQQFSSSSWTSSVSIWYRLTFDLVIEIELKSEGPFADKKFFKACWWIPLNVDKDNVDTRFF